MSKNKFQNLLEKEFVAEKFEDLLYAASILKQNNRTQSASEITEHLFNVEKNTRIASAGYWNAMSAQNYDFASACVDYITNEANNTKSKNLQKWLIGKREKIENRPLSPQEAEQIVENIKQTDKVTAERNKICYLLHNSLPISSGGYATRAHGIATGLKQNNYNIVCVTRPGFPIDVESHAGNHQPTIEIDGINYNRIFEPTRKNSSGRNYVLKSADAITEFLLSQNPEVVIAASNHHTALPALIAAKRLGLKFFYEIRGFWEVTRESREPEYAKTEHYAQQVFLETLVSQHADHVFTLTTRMREELIARGVPADKITLAPNSCNPERFDPVDRDPTLAAKYNIPSHVPVIGYIGTFAQYEGLEDLTAACALLKQRGIEFRLMLVGNENTSGNSKGPITEEILKIAQKSGLADWLIMPGRIPHEDVEAHYSLIDIAPFPRKPQPVTEMVSPMKPLEALAMEKAVIVSSVCALQEMIQDGETGLHFEKGSRDNLCDKLMMLVKDPELRKKLGQNGRKWVKNERTWEKTTQNIAQVIHSFL